MASSILSRGLLLVTIASASTLYSTYSFNPLHHLAGIAPYFESQDPPTSPDAPQGCTATKAAYLVRHAAIYANDFDNEEYIEPFVEKFNNKSGIDWSKIPSLNFLADWKPPLSEADVSLLTRVGRLEASQLGVDLNFRYPNFKIPERIWTSTANRTQKSAQSLAQGLESVGHDIQIVAVIESKQLGANSLTPYKSCPGYSSSAGSKEASTYQKIYTKPIMARLNSLIPDFNFTSNDIFGMQQLCGYETVIRGKSPFCSLDLFTPDDWLGWEYSEDIRYHYNVGYGAKVSGYVGLPWLKATANMLMDKPTEQDQDLFVSFTHRELPPMVLVAMGLFNNSQFSTSNLINTTMPLDQINHRRDWRSSHILPFLTNIAIERFNCSKSYGYDDGEYYRVLVNSAPQALPDCNDGPGTSCSRTGFDNYIKSRSAMFSGFSKNCGSTNSSTAEKLSIYENPSTINSTNIEKRYYASFSK